MSGSDDWEGFLRHLKRRGLLGVRLVISDNCLRLNEALDNLYLEASCQRCIARFYRTAFIMVSKGKVQEVAAMLEAIHPPEDRADAQTKAAAVVTKFRAMRLGKAAKRLAEGGSETLTYYGFPRARWRRIQTNPPPERIMREIQRSTPAVGAFPDGQSALILAADRLRHLTATRWGTRRYLDMKHLKAPEKNQLRAAH